MKVIVTGGAGFIGANFLNQLVPARNWLYVTDHREAIWTVIETGQLDRTCNIGGNNEMRNVDVVDTRRRIVAEVGRGEP